MIIENVMKEIGDAIDTIPMLERFDFWVGKVPVPGFTVGLPEETVYDQTYGRGSDTLTVPVVVLVGKVDNQSAARQLMAYMDGSGPRSFKAVLEAHSWTTCDDVMLASAEPGAYSSGGVALLGAEFMLTVLGQGETS